MDKRTNVFIKYFCLKLFLKSSQRVGFAKQQFSSGFITLQYTTLPCTQVNTTTLYSGFFPISYNGLNMNTLPILSPPYQILIQ